MQLHRVQAGAATQHMAGMLGGKRLRENEAPVSCAGTSNDQPVGNVQA